MSEFWFLLTAYLVWFSMVATVIIVAAILEHLDIYPRRER